MNNNQYIKALKKALSGLDKATRNDIIKEIQSHVAESGEPLIERFGTPDELSKQYLDGEVQTTRTSKKILGIGKTLFTVLGIVFALVCAAIALLVWALTGDDFNYADEQASELISQDTAWTRIDWSAVVSMNLNQASTVFYWHDENTIKWSCSGNYVPNISEQSIISIEKAKCLIYVPKQALSMKARQSKIVLVRPQAAVEAVIDQVQLEVAENGETYNYVSEVTRSRLQDLHSHANAAHTIRIQAIESNIGQYEF